VSAADARQVADDFLFLGTTAATAATLVRQYDLGPLLDRLGLGEAASAGTLLILPLDDLVKGYRLLVYDSAMRPRVELLPDTGQGYVRRAGEETLRGGLRPAAESPLT